MAEESKVYRRLVFVDVDGVLNNSVDEECYHSVRPISKNNIRVFNKLIKTLNNQCGKVDYTSGHAVYMEPAQGANPVLGEPWRLPPVECVLSSTWRLHYLGLPNALDEIKKDFKGYGTKCNWVGHTPRHLYVAGKSMERGVEINSWIQKNCQGQYVSFCILDDDRDMLGLKEHLVYVTGKTGLLEIDIQDAVRVMSRVWHVSLSAKGEK